MKEYYLQTMGVTQWQWRFQYLVLIRSDELEGKNLSIEKQLLLDRILQALNWQKDRTKIVFTPDLGLNHYSTVIERYSPQKVLVFGDKFDKLKNVAGISVLSLSALLSDPQAKRKAWEMMKTHL